MHTNLHWRGWDWRLVAVDEVPHAHALLEGGRCHDGLVPLHAQPPICQGCLIIGAITRWELLCKRREMLC